MVGWFKSKLMKSDEEGRLVNRSNISQKLAASLFKGPISTQTSIFYQLWLFILTRHSGSMLVDRGVIILQSYQKPFNCSCNLELFFYSCA